MSGDLRALARAAGQALLELADALDRQRPEPTAAPAYSQRGGQTTLPPPRSAAPSDRSTSNSRELTIPGGREKGTPLSASSDEALSYWRDRIENDRSPDPKFAAQNRRLLDAIHAELRRRGR